MEGPGNMYKCSLKGVGGLRVTEVCSAWCIEMTPAQYVFPVDARNDKIHHQINVRIYFRTWLSLPSMELLLDKFQHQ